MNELFPEGEQRAEHKEQNPQEKSVERHDDDAKKETQKSLDALHADVQIDQEGHAVEWEKRNEIIDTKNKIEDLHTTVEQRAKSKEQNERPSSVADYENMTQEQITAAANKGRAESVHVVSQMIENTSFVPKRLKKMTT